MRSKTFFFILYFAVEDVYLSTLSYKKISRFLMLLFIIDPLISVYFLVNCKEYQETRLVQRNAL